MLKDRPALDQRKIDAIIEKGGRTSAAESEQPQNVQMRLMPALLARIDSVRNREPKEVRQSRHAWIMRAILDKLKVEE